MTPGYENAPAPGPIKENGQHSSYWVLSEAERAKGFVRPVRRTYRHVGIRPKYPLRDLTAEEQQQYAQFKYSKYEEYPPGETMVGRFWTDDQLKSGCNSETSMSQAIAETYARDPKFYGATFCCHCGKHIGVEQFVWIDDGSVVGS